MKIHVNSELKKINGITYDLKGIPELTANNIKLVDSYVINNSSYSNNSGDDFVRKYFQGHLEEPLELSTIITRIIFIDTIDSTNLKLHLGKDYYKLMAERIQNEDLELIIKDGGKLGNKFEKIAKWELNSKTKNLFSFVSKYITRVNEYSYHRHDYSIMDSVVKKYLPLFKQIGVKVPNIEDLRKSYDYDAYCGVIDDIITKYDGVTKGMLDHFIWFSFKDEAVGDLSE